MILFRDIPYFFSPGMLDTPILAILGLDLHTNTNFLFIRSVRSAQGSRREGLRAQKDASVLNPSRVYKLLVERIWLASSLIALGNYAGLEWARLIH